MNKKEIYAMIILGAPFCVLVSLELIIFNWYDEIYRPSAIEATIVIIILSIISAIIYFGILLILMTLKKKKLSEKKLKSS